MITSSSSAIRQQSKKIDTIIKGFITEYELTQTPIEVSFRALLPELRTERFTHLIHTYPAKLLVHIPYFFLNNTIFSKPGDTVLDPFCGTGTVLLEALLAGRNALGADANPLARLIAEVKTVRCSDARLKKTLELILKIKDCDGIVPVPSVVNIDYWFNPNNKSSLSHILQSINEVQDQHLKNFFLVCFSNLVKKVSFADPRVSVPVRLNEKRYKEDSQSFIKVKKRLSDLENVNVYEKFSTICVENIHRMSLLNKHFTDTTEAVNATVIATDARNLTDGIVSLIKHPDESIQLIVTSPPYAGAQKYIRSSSLSLGWLGIASTDELRALDKLNIGRENYSKGECQIKLTGIKSCDILIDKISNINPLRAQIVSNYVIEMQSAIRESIRVLKKDGYFVMIVGNNKVCGFEFSTQQYLTEYIEKQGLELVFKLIDDIKSYGLMTKRNKTADIISREWVLVFRK